MSQNEMVVVATYGNELYAEIAWGVLDAEGIEAFIAKDDAGAMIPSLQQTGGVRILVAAEDADRALEILESDIDVEDEYDDYDYEDEDEYEDEDDV
ncbi:MAG: DUF2007 domain-containing protein [Anaerolineae bacterium]|nr:DUF2007 domain-containing protein [Anaerolineae bacterium]